MKEVKGYIEMLDFRSTIDAVFSKVSSSQPLQSGESDLNAQSEHKISKVRKTWKAGQIYLSCASAPVT